MNKTGIIHTFDAGSPQSLALVSLEARFHFWRGKSGTKRLFTVYAPEAVEPCDAVAVLVRLVDGGRVPVFVGAVSEVDDLKLLCVMRGADEVHLHLMATSEGERRAVVADYTSALIMPALAEECLLGG